MKPAQVIVLCEDKQQRVFVRRFMKPRTNHPIHLRPGLGLTSDSHDAGHRAGNRALRPFLKWAGGKRQLLPVLRDFYPDGFGTFPYHEPFLGSGVYRRCSSIWRAGSAAAESA